MLQGCWLASFDEDHYCNELKSYCISLIIQANFCWAKIPIYQLHDSHTQSPIAATMPFQITSLESIDPNIVNSQLSPSCMNMTDVIIQWTKHQKKTQNPSKKPQTISHPSTLHSARNIPTHNTKLWTTIQPVHTIHTTRNLQLGSPPYASYWPNILQREDSQCHCAPVGKRHPPLQHCFAHNWHRAQEPRFGQLQGTAAVGWLEDSFRNFGSLFSLSESFLDSCAPS